MQYIHLMALFDLTWTLLSIRPILICHLLHPLESLLTRFGLAVVISPVSVADKAKSDDWTGLDLTIDLLRSFFNLIKKYP